MALSYDNGRWSNADQDRVVLSEPDPGWPSLFAAEAAMLRALLPHEIVKQILHVGSTAIPGLLAKPVIDILLVPGPEYRRNRLIHVLEGVGYLYWADNPRRDRVFCVKGMPPFGRMRTHHAHVRPEAEARDMIMFRDYLVANPRRAHEYGSLKRSLAHRFATDRDAYTRAKDEFVEEILKKARAVPSWYSAEQ